MAIMARAASLRGFCALVGELGGDGPSLLDRFAITTEAIANDDALIPGDAIGWVLEAAAAELHCPDFGLRLATRQDHAVLGPLAVAMANARSIGDAVSFAARFLFTHHAGLSIAFVADPEQQPGVIALHYGDPGEIGGFSQGIDLAAGTIHRTL
ncbi:AraC family transcriptional regulator ligand-binding domain-containing protein [Nocardia crassostreae]|uniref:AraC family transcriptional regulator ligand-binding domain-containing protein n=1 Tax=Nocardia crassostreae TaxID=53428 RepID=UPI000AE0B98E|nr:AraC family transcriptional regulator ligand-binding domain-containing protein [Nocardia crassostreae]